MPSATPAALSRMTTALTPVVGLGASAGGLEALGEFLAHTPADTGMAYIVVQHLNPTQKGMLPELLQRATTLPVHQARHGMRITANCVYVIPPNTELSVLDDTLQLTLPAEPRGRRLPINVLFASLARTRRERAIAIVFSGMGADGTLGLQAIKAVGGLTAAQAPASAKFDSMPGSAIAAGCVDIVATPAELPARLLARLAAAPEGGGSGEDKAPAGDTPPLQTIIRLLQQRTRHDFSLYKPSTMNRRIERRMAVHDLRSLPDYAEFLARNPQEIDLLFKEWLIGVTSFFRDKPVWDHLESVTIPALLARHPEAHKFRIWVVGCSTGEEAYSLAMVFREAIDKLPAAHESSVQILASDLNPDAIATARRGRFPLSISADVPADRLARFFSAHDTHYQVSQDIRDMVVFAEHNVVLDPPFTRLDLIACRNLLIYFDASLQRKLLPVFHYSLRSGGLLLLGRSESAGQSQRLFVPIQSKFRLYLRQENATLSKPDLLPKSFPPLTTPTKDQPVPHTPPPHDASNNLQTAADQILLQAFAPAAVVINQKGDIVYISGRTGNYLEPAAGKANWNIHVMARDGLRTPLLHALKQSALQSEPVQLPGLEVAIPGGIQVVDVVVQPLQGANTLRGMTMIVFRDAAQIQAGPEKGPAKDPAASMPALTLLKYQEEINNLREEARASREELQSANEELQSTNEELQSTNEELQFTIGELQSTNGELTGSKSELQTRLDDLLLAQSDMQNVLNSIEIAILFLDQNLNVRRYTERVTNIINLRDSDIGRPLSDLTTTLDYPTLHEDALQTLRTLVFAEKQVRTRDGKWFSARIMPYRRLDNVIDGVVVTLLDITSTKELEAALRSKEAP